MSEGAGRPYGVAILGFGFIGKVHAYAHVNLPFFYSPPPVRTRLVGVATRRPETAAKAKADFGFDVATTDALSLIARDDVDIVHICTPNDAHLPALRAAIRAGKHIYCDKPLTATADEAAEVESLLGGYRGVGQMTFQYRFLPATLRARQLIDEGRIGPITHFRAEYLHAGSVDRTRPLNWKADATRGGGVIADLLSHVIDLVGHLIGSIEPTYAVRRVWVDRRQSLEDRGREIPTVGEDCVLAVVRTADGAPGVLEASKIATGAEDELRFEIHGERGALRFNLMEPNGLDYYDAAEPDGPVGGTRGWRRIATVHRYPAPAGFPGPKNAVGWLRAHVACLHHFLDAVATGRPADPDLRHGVAIQRVLAAVHRLAESA